MQTPVEPLSGHTFDPRLRVFAGRQLVLGAGKIMLLQQIEKTGSLAEAARQMQVSYNHAWTLLRVMNRSFREPLTEMSRGGTGRGGAALTPAGHAVLALYAEMTEQCRQAAAPHWKALKKLLRPAAEIDA